MDSLALSNVPTMPENAHERNSGSPKEFPSKLLVWSAADEESLHRLIDLYTQYFEHNQRIVDERFIDHLAFTLNTRRSSLAWKAFAVVKSFDNLSNLKQTLSKPIRAIDTGPRIGFVFTGQGAQWYGMGRELLIYPVFRASLLRSQAILRDLSCEWILLGIY